MISEPFSKGNSLIKKLDPRIRIILASVYSFAIALLDNLPSLAIALVFSIGIAFLAGLDFKEASKRIALVNILILVLWILLPLTFRGEALFYLGPFPFTFEGVLVSSRITLKSNAILLMIMALISSMSIATLGHAMNRLRLPEKIVSLLLITYRYIFVMEQEYERLSRAAKVRGFRPKTNMHTYRTYAYLVGMLFVRASERAERVHKAMLCRGFRGKFYCLSEFSISPLDWVFSFSMGLLIAALEFIEWTGIM